MLLSPHEARTALKALIEIRDLLKEILKEMKRSGDVGTTKL